jgi:hypothetical protein
VSIVVDITEISAIVAAAGVMVGVILTVLELRNLLRQRKTDLVTSLYSSTFNNKEFTEAGLLVMSLEYKDYGDFVKKYGQMNAKEPIWVAVNLATNFFNELGILLHEKSVRAKTIDELFGYRVALFWEKLKPLIDGMRKQLNPRVSEWFEYLYNEMQRFQQSKKD